MSPEEKIFEKHQRRQEGYRDAFEDFGERSGLREFAHDWRSAFREMPSPEEEERYKAMRREVYADGAKCCCGKAPHWITEETLATLTTCKTSAG
jgi:hypothetical protein